jgi:hypothetical protein
MTDGPKGVLLRGARELAEYIFGDEKYWRSIYTVGPELPLFMMGGMISGYTVSIDAALARKEAAGREPTTAQARRCAKRLAAHNRGAA